MAVIDDMNLDEWMKFEDSHSVCLGSSRAEAPLAWPKIETVNTSEKSPRQADSHGKVSKSPKRKLR